MTMITHRDIAMPAFLDFISAIRNECKGWKVLEIGPRDNLEFRHIFESIGCEWQGIDMYPVEGVDKVISGMQEDLPFQDKTFDIVFSCHTFEHTIAPPRTVAEMKRVCKKHIFVITPYHCRHQVLHGDDTHFFVPTDLQMERLLIANKLNKKVLYVQKNAPLEQDYNLITWAEVSDNGTI